jgi:hypothetical protein
MAPLTRAAVAVLSVLLSALCAHAGDSRKDGAFLVLSRVISGDLVESQNVTVTYEVHNLGEA